MLLLLVLFCHAKGIAASGPPSPTPLKINHRPTPPDIALIGDVLIACGDGDAATLWRISPAAANGTVLVPASATSAGAAPVCTVPRTAGAHPDANVTMRSWLEGGSAAGGTPRAGLKRAGGGPGTAANSCVGALVEELTALTVDAGDDRPVAHSCQSGCCVALLCNTAPAAVLHMDSCTNHAAVDACCVTTTSAENAL